MRKVHVTHPPGLIGRTFQAAGRGFESCQAHRAYYDQLRACGKTHRQALGQLAKRRVGILHICLDRRCVYDETSA
jgi:hypothetical protein